MQTEITKQCSHYYVKSSENTFVYVLIATLYSDHIYLFRNMNYMWNERTILGKDLTVEWIYLTWNDLTMKKNDRKPNRSTICSITIKLKP